MVVSRASLFRFAVMAAAAVGLPALVMAQSRGGTVANAPAGGRLAAAVVRAAPAPRAVAASTVRAPMRAPSAPSNMVPVVAQPRMPRTSRVHPRSRVNTFLPVDFSSFDFQDVPGLGFDFPHLAAVNGNHVHHRHFPRNVPFFDGFLLTSPSVVVEQPAPVEEQAAAEDLVASDVIEEQPVVRRRRIVREPEVQASAARTAEPAPQRDMEQFVFVRRDGSLVFAVAYTWENDTLRYITPEGLRRTIERGALDLNATQQFNEQRGVSFRAPE